MNTPADERGDAERDARLDAIARLAGGLAHDLNNLLTPIVAYGNLLTYELKEGTPAREFADEMVQAGDRMVELTKLLQRLRVKPGATQAVDLVAGLQGARSRLPPALAAPVTFVEDLAACPGCRFEPQQLDGVLEAILRNACQAAGPGGRVTIVAGPEGAPEGFVRVSIRDTGPGMDPEVQAHLFEPYFTTRPKGEGRGLGLALSRAAVCRSGGRIHVHSAPGRGTELELFLRREAQ